MRAVAKCLLTSRKSFRGTGRRCLRQHRLCVLMITNKDSSATHLKKGAKKLRSLFSYDGYARLGKRSPHQPKSVERPVGARSGCRNLAGVPAERRTASAAR